MAKAKPIILTEEDRARLVTITKTRTLQVQVGIENAIYDATGRGQNSEIIEDEKNWIINVTCQKPADLGYSAEIKPFRIQYSC